MQCPNASHAKQDSLIWYDSQKAHPANGTLLYKAEYYFLVR